MNRVYIAAPFFNDNQVTKVKVIEDLLESLGYHYFSPRNGGFQDEHEYLLGRQAIYHTDIKFLNRADIVVAVLDDNDPGTVFEIGYAAAKDKDIILVSYDDKDGMNLMLSQSCYAYVRNISDLGQVLHEIHKVEPSVTDWKIMNERQSC